MPLTHQIDDPYYLNRQQEALKEPSFLAISRLWEWFLKGFLLDPDCISPKDRYTQN